MDEDWTESWLKSHQKKPSQRHISAVAIGVSLVLQKQQRVAFGPSGRPATCAGPARRETTEPLPGLDCPEDGAEMSEIVGCNARKSGRNEQTSRVEARKRKEK